MILFYYIDKNNKNLIGNENLIFDNDNKKIILNDKDWYFMVLDSNIDSSDPSTAASLKAIYNLKLYIKDNYISTADVGKLPSIDSDTLKKLEDTDSSIINRLNQLDTYVGINNTKDDVINSYKEVEEFLQSVSDASTLLSMLTLMETSIQNKIPLNLSGLVNDCNFVSKTEMDDAIANAKIDSDRLDTIDSSIAKLQDLLAVLDKPAYYEPRYSSNSLYASSGIEVGAELTTDYFTASPGQAHYGYPETYVLWSAQEISLTRTQVGFGYTSNLASCTFKLSYNNEYPLLKTYMLKDQTDVKINQDESETLQTGIYGYYNWGWYSSNNKNDITTTSYNKDTISSNFDGYLILTTDLSSYVYIVLPASLKISSFAVQSPFNPSDFTEVDNFSVIASNLEVSQLSSINKQYNIWCCGKSTNNADGTVTPNALPIKISTQLA